MSDFARDLPDAGSRFAERRSVPRYSVEWKVELVDPVKNTRLIGQTADLSVRGCRLQPLLPPIEIDTILRLRFGRKTETLDIWARVVHLNNDHGFGLAFLRTHDDDRSILLRWISEEIG
jgi:hypothetical protein